MASHRDRVARPVAVLVARLKARDGRGPRREVEAELGFVRERKFHRRHNVAGLVLGPNVLDPMIFRHAYRCSQIRNTIAMYSPFILLGPLKSTTSVVRDIVISLTVRDHNHDFSVINRDLGNMLFR